MKAMVLSAGYGTRLRPLTWERAKPAVPLLGAPLIVRLLEALRGMGIQSFRINLHHLPHTIESLFSLSPWASLPVSFSYESRILGTAGGLKANEAFFDEGTFLMVNGDILLGFPLADALAMHRERNALATLILFPQSPPYPYYPMRIDSGNRLVDFKGFGSERSPRPGVYVFSGVHILEPEIFRYIPPGTFSSITDEAYMAALNDGKQVYGFPVSGYWNDIGDPRRYLLAQQDLLRGTGLCPPVAISPLVGKHPSSRVGPFVSAGKGCRFERDSAAENAILWENVRMKSGSRIRNCIVGSDVTVAGCHANKIITRFGVSSIV